MAGRPAGGRKRPPGIHHNRTGSSALAPAGAPRAAARALPRAPPVPGRPPSRPPSTQQCGNGHPPGVPVLTRAKITVKSATAYGLRVLRMALRATPDCDLGRFKSAPVGRMARPEVDKLRRLPGGSCPAEWTGTHTVDRCLPQLPETRLLLSARMARGQANWGEPCQHARLVTAGADARAVTAAAKSVAS